ncbi:hypothetical protein Val02_28450 [Virgisporangium aliadipatigenens]|uniref:ADP-ribosylglycohydrolase n=1 Tax=Virgisporangium aliadipatigenens TaxID=741659 RepID=A0A8J3YII6_9ACTN|nr:ADP-ribosylglycohydrolase family protein [Virgisporangium aliadipatigenens]GIJ45959.1 hypothetical protein Val02_28450 [Virgisporangium aliadipatigenens]
MTQRAKGALFGLAYGDALGAPTEFLSMTMIAERYGPRGPRELETGRVTDDTQMTISVAAALAGGPLEPVGFAERLRTEFLAWAISPDNDRAPGNTCLRACANLGDPGVTWQEATIVGSKGCGANMRVAPVGLVPDLTDDDRAGAAQLQAALTHGHPTGLAASELTAFAVWWLRCGAVAPKELPAALRERARSQRRVYRADWLGGLWKQSHHPSPEHFVATGWDECLDALDRLDTALAAGDRDADPCLVTGSAWVAEEALVTSLLCFLLFPEDPVAAISRGATSSGDSDSIACLAGAYAGASLGFPAWPSHWENVIEYADDLHRYSSVWD